MKAKKFGLKNELKNYLINLQLFILIFVDDLSSVENDTQKVHQNYNI